MLGIVTEVFGEKVDRASERFGKFVGGVLTALLHSSEVIAVGAVSFVRHSPKRPIYEFDTDQFGMEASIEDGPIGMFMIRRPGELMGPVPVYVYSVKEAQAYIDRIPEDQIHWADRRWLRLQVTNAGLPKE